MREIMTITVHTENAETLSTAWLHEADAGLDLFGITQDDEKVQSESCSLSEKRNI